jgi:hypothetical protein
MCSCAVHCTLNAYHDKGCCDAGACQCSCHGDIKLYLDDVRETPEGWFRVYTIDQVFYWLQSRRVTHMSLDNDLGHLDPKTEGFNVLDRLEEWVYFDSTFPIPEITVHSSNASRKEYMNRVIRKLEAIRQQQIAE